MREGRTGFTYIPCYPQIKQNGYIGNWLTVLKDDKRAIFTAAAHAQRAVDFLHALSGKAEEADAECLQAA